MIRVAITTYEPTEQTFWTHMPQVPRVGESIATVDPDLPVLQVTRVRWVQGRETWWAECSAR